MTKRMLKQYRFCRDHQNDSTLGEVERQANRQLTLEVQCFVNSIDDSMIRQAIRMRYMDGGTAPKWDKIANKIGGGNSADSIRKSVVRYLERH